MSTPIVRRRKRPVEVDTIQWTGSNEADVRAFTGPGSFYALDDEDRAGCDDPEATATVFDNLHNTWVLVYTGQHIVRGVRREYYPIAEGVLADTYDTVDDFFEPGHTYTETSNITDWQFRCDSITTHPEDGERTALGWRHFRGEWEPYAYGEDDWEIHRLADHIDVGAAGGGRG